MFDIVTIGGVVKDVIFYTDQGKFFSTPDNLTAQKMLAFEYGSKIDIKESYLSIGGGAANSAVSFSRLGCKTAIIAKTGNDALGQEIIKKLNKEGVNTSLVHLDSKSNTGLSLILTVTKGEREHIAFVDRGANKFLTLNKNNFSGIKTNWFYLTALAGKNWPGNLKAIFGFAAQNKIKIAWNPGSFQLQAGKKALAGFLKQTEVLILNKDEAIELVLSGIKIGRKNPTFLNKPVYLLNILQEWGSKIVVITNGKKGAWVHDGKNIYHQKIVKAKVINTVGVGDAFGSAFLAGLLAKNNISKALKWGMINSGSVVTKVGAEAGLLTLKELLKKV
ncbi:MAG: carbohydrate kinase family protein [Patescibacteria group bacterium]